jgi:DNA-binding NarL/FixJ family response regulator
MKIMIVDDHALIRKGLKSMLSSYHGDWEILEAGNGIQAILTSARIKPDMVLMDFAMPKLDGAKAARQMIKDHPTIHIIMISGFISQYDIQLLLEIGIKGIVSKSAGSEEILETIFEVQQGKVHFSVNNPTIFEKEKKELTDSAENQFKNDLLTHRELEIILLLVQGLRTDTIAEELNISKKTLSAHKVNIFKKCNVHSTVELIRYAYRNNIA